MLRFTPTAWAKLQFFCHHGPTEIGGFGITNPKDLILVEEFITVRQAAGPASVAFDDAAVADFFETQVDCGKRPAQFARVWLHTHPGDSPVPSGTDEETFCRVFGRCDWAVMFILARRGNTYARLGFHIGPGGALQIPVEVDYHREFAGSDHQTWLLEYEQNIQQEVMTLGPETPAFGWDPNLDGLGDSEFGQQRIRPGEAHEDAPWWWSESGVWP